jgi:predicted RNA-binding protein with PUA-like domain
MAKAAKSSAARQYWLVKSEPGSWSWDDQVRDKRTHWNGVRNHQASNNLKAMKLGDRCFFYHSVDEKRIVGVVEVVKEYYPDPTDETGRFGMVDVAALAPLATPVTLGQIKEDPKLNHLGLVRQSRLSVLPVDADAWARICALGGVKA